MSITDRADELRRRLELYRSYLHRGVASDEAAMYIRAIRDDEAELANLLKTRESKGTH